MAQRSRSRVSGGLEARSERPAMERGQPRAGLGEFRHDRLKPVLQQQAERVPHGTAVAVPNRIAWRAEANVRRRDMGSPKPDWGE